MKFQTITLISAGDAATNLVSEAVDLRYNYGFAVQCTFTGSPTGAVVIEGSNNGTSWSQIDSLTISGTTVLSSNKDAIYWPFVRARKDSGGTGTATVTMTIKGA